MIDFDDVYKRYFNYVYRYILSLCRNTGIAEDITQETFFKALRNFEDFNKLIWKLLLSIFSIELLWLDNVRYLSTSFIKLSYFKEYEIGILINVW